MRHGPTGPRSRRRRRIGRGCGCEHGGPAGSARPRRAEDTFGQGSKAEATGIGARCVTRESTLIRFCRSTEARRDLQSAIAANDLQGSVTRFVSGFAFPSPACTFRHIPSPCSALLRCRLCESRFPYPCSLLLSVRKADDASRLRVRFARLSRIRVILGCPKEEVDLPYDASTFVEDDEYLILDVVLNWVSGLTPRPSRWNPYIP